MKRLIAANIQLFAGYLSDADSGEVAHLFRFERAHHSDFISLVVPG